jgi:hypothetical protein
MTSHNSHFTTINNSYVTTHKSIRLLPVLQQINELLKINDK